MKMVSQLTRQAMERHRLLAISGADSVPQLAAAHPALPEPRPLAPPALPAAQPIPTAVSEPTPPRRQAPAAPRTSIYSQLMSKHDRLNARHLSLRNT